MASTPTAVGAVAEAATGVAVVTTASEAEGVAGMPREAELVLNRQEQRGDKSHNTNDNEGDRYDDDRGGGGCGGFGGARGSEDKTHQYEHCHRDNIPQHEHNTKRRHHLPKSNHHQHRHDEEEAYQLVPPDGGWAWMVALGTVLIMTLLPMMVTCFSVLFSEYLLSTGSSSTTTAWIFNLQSFLLNGSAILARSLTEEFGWRRVALVSSAMASLGLMMSAFTPSPAFLFFSFSLLTGCGSGVVSCQCFTILPHYFQRRRGLANGIMMSGISIGQLVGPPVTRFFQDAYGFRGAILIVGAISLNACVGATFFHPYQWHQKKVLLVKPQEDVPMISTKAEAVGPNDLTRRFVHSPSEAPFICSTAEEIESGLVVRERLLKSPGGRNVSCPSPSSRYSSTLTLSSCGMDSVAGLAVEDELEKNHQGDEGRGGVLPVRIAKSLISDLGVLKYLRVWILCVGDTLCIIAYINFIMMVPFAMLEAGFSLDTSAWCLSLSSGCNMVTRLLVSALTDWPRINKRAVYMAGFAVIAISISAFTFVSSVAGIMVTMAVHGIGVGMNMSIYNIIIIDVMGVENLSSVFGTASFCVAIGFLCLGPLIGFMRDVTQNYMVSMHIMAGFAYVALAVWFFMGQAEKIDRRREESKKLRTAPQKT